MANDFVFILRVPQTLIFLSLIFYCAILNVFKVEWKRFPTLGEIPSKQLPSAWNTVI